MTTNPLRRVDVSIVKFYVMFYVILRDAAHHLPSGQRGQRLRRPRRPERGHQHGPADVLEGFAEEAERDVFGAVGTLRE